MSVFNQGSILAVGNLTKPSPCRSGRYKNGGKTAFSPSAVAILICANVVKIVGTQGKMLIRWPSMSMPKDKSNQGEVSGASASPDRSMCTSSASRNHAVCPDTKFTSKPACRKAAKSLSSHVSHCCCDCGSSGGKPSMLTSKATMPSASSASQALSSLGKSRSNMRA